MNQPGLELHSFITLGTSTLSFQFTLRTDKRLSERKKKWYFNQQLSSMPARLDPCWLNYHHLRILELRQHSAAA